jgi:hypothetical protein
LLISIYSVVDAAAVRLVSPLPYLMIVLGFAGLLISPMVMRRYGYRAVFALAWRSIWKDAHDWSSAHLRRDSDYYSCGVNVLVRLMKIPQLMDCVR